MVIGVPKEIKAHEYRVALTPDGASALSGDGHRVLCERGLGKGSGFKDKEYRDAGAVLTDRDEVYGSSKLILKVKEPVKEEYGLIRKGQALFTFLHLAPNRELTEVLLEKSVAGFAYETLEYRGSLPLLEPMSEIAGRMSPLVAAFFLQRPQRGRGVLSPGVPGVPPAEITVLGAGSVGANAVRIAVGLGMRVTVINRGIGKLRALDREYPGRVLSLPATEESILRSVTSADAVVGAVLVPGGKAPVLVARKTLKKMREGAVVVDVAIDQGGCFESSRPTTHDDPVYIEEGVLHYAVANMPGAYPRTSTLALTNITLPFMKRLASLGVERAIREDPVIRTALNTFGAEVTHRELAGALGLACRQPKCL
jgi:alanine dehydrogenase